MITLGQELAILEPLHLEGHVSNRDEPGSESGTLVRLG
jgi:hypothetical protein